MSKTILTIDDSASIRQMVAMTLKSAGHIVIEAGDGAQGYDQATSHTLDAVITDLNMPVMNGIEFIRKYRTHPSSKGVPILLLTTESDDELKRQAVSAIDDQRMEPEAILQLAIARHGKVVGRSELASFQFADQRFDMV